MPPCTPQQGCDTTITVTPVLCPGPIRSCPGPGDPHRLRTLKHNRVSIDVAVGLCKHSVRRHRTCAAPSRCNCAALRGLEVSLRDFTQNEFIQCKGGNRPAKSFVLLLNPLQLLELTHPHTAPLLAPTIIRLFRNLDLANSVNT